MANVLDFGEKRIYELSEIRLLTDEAILLISQDHLTRSIKLSTLRRNFVGEGAEADKFYSTEDMDAKINTINRNLLEYYNKLSAFEGTISDNTAIVERINQEIQNQLSNFSEEIDLLRNYTNEQLEALRSNMSQFQYEIREYMTVVEGDLIELVGQAKSYTDEKSDKLTAEMHHIYGYGPVVPTVLPEGKFFLQTFNMSYIEKPVAEYTYTISELNDTIAHLKIQQVGEKVATMWLYFTNDMTGFTAASGVIPIDVTIKDAILGDLIVYDSDMANPKWGLTENGLNETATVELGTFMIPTYDSTIQIRVGKGIVSQGDSEIISFEFTNHEHDIWAGISGILNLHLTDENGSYLTDENGDFLAETGSTDEVPTV